LGKKPQNIILLPKAAKVFLHNPYSKLPFAAEGSETLFTQPQDFGGSLKTTIRLVLPYSFGYSERIGKYKTKE
jgi:hypothetical protein